MDMDACMQRIGCEHREATKARFLNDSDFYLEIVTEMLQDPGFEQLAAQLKQRQTAAAFETAHMLKGVIGNCGVTPLYDGIVQIVEPLRTGDPDFEKLEERCRQMLCIRDELKTRLTQ